MRVGGTGGSGWDSLPMPPKMVEWNMAKPSMVRGMTLSAWSEPPRDGIPFYNRQKFGELKKNSDFLPVIPKLDFFLTFERLLFYTEATSPNNIHRKKFVEYLFNRNLISFSAKGGFNGKMENNRARSGTGDHSCLRSAVGHAGLDDR
ncbi:hypothetical protein DESC_940021 [Desulfosarcina cetonica]|uniref:hypothetical protein n=1 Tax=Desulfosarcina cetonica TaxID=90730 RepID=UPI00155DC1C1|nr:hypothetical protein [Desulfosarcina cetonica]VTR71406.1 hypothetical protein DESC_940021 [Desulfosarcina cetonica]